MYKIKIKDKCGDHELIYRLQRVYCQCVVELKYHTLGVVIIYIRCVQNILFENFNVQAGMDASGVPTDMLTLNSTVRIFYRNPATFFGVHVTSTPIHLHYLDLKVASGHVSFLFLFFNLIVQSYLLILFRIKICLSSIF